MSLSTSGPVAVTVPHPTSPVPDCNDGQFEDRVVWVMVAVSFCIGALMMLLAVTFCNRKRSSHDMYTGSVGMPVKDLSGPYSNSTGRGVVLLRPQADDDEVELDPMTMRTREPSELVSTPNDGPKRTLSNYKPQSQRTRTEPEVFTSKNRTSRTQDLNTFVDTSLSV